ncbi:uncharacterized protein LOC121421960 [Lytechinus variegatus]|uniref:uncharacterized protein LOC121421960 n=2 Tax=Lytechinus variegatus TaxID=7654 RepID=UPI001BB1E10C|nr:uncharacterized protein LOC121421960 [Lytechinus variegatus]
MLSPQEHLEGIHQQFIASQQRKWGRGATMSKIAKDAPRTPKDTQGGIRRMTKRRRPKHKPLKKSPPILNSLKKRSPIIHLPPALHTPSRPQKRIKLASTEPHQDQVVPLSSILHPNLTIPYPSSRGAGSGRSRVGTQMVPDSPRGQQEDIQQENMYTDENDAPASPVIDVCKTPCKARSLKGSSVISTPMKTYQIIGTSITPVKIAYNVDSQGDREEIPGPEDRAASLDLVCDEEPTSWPEDDSSSSSGSIPELHISQPWFSTPVHPPILPKCNLPLDLSAKHKQYLPSGPPVLEPMWDQTKAMGRKEPSRENILKESGHGASVKTTPRKKYQKRATAARVRAWDASSGRVLSPVQPYSGVFKALQQRKAELASVSKSPDVVAISPSEYHGHPQQPGSGFDTPECFMSSSLRYQLVERLNSDIVYVTDFTQESDEEVIDLLGLDSTDHDARQSDSVVPTPSLDRNPLEDSSPTCLRDVSIPPPTGTISPPSLARHSSMGYDESPELFKGFRSLWLKDTKTESCIVVDPGPDIETYQPNEDSFSGYTRQMRRDLENTELMEQEEDLFEADLGDMRHLDPALQLPSSSLDSQDYIVLLRRDEIDELDSISVVSDTEDNRASPRFKKKSVKPAEVAADGLITPALASFATSALSMKHTRPTNLRPQRKRRKNIRLNLPKAPRNSGEDEDDLNIWKFTQAALNEKDVLGFLPTDTSYAFITNNY